MMSTPGPWAARAGRDLLHLAGPALLVGLLAVACSSAEPTSPDVESTFPDDAFSIMATRDLGTGASRVLVGVLQEDGARLGSPAQRVDIEVAPADAPEKTQAVAGVFTWIIEDVVGLYRAEFDFDRPGTWTMTVQPEDGDPLPATPFTVLEKTFSPNVGEPAPVAPTPTLRSHTLEELTSDPSPDQRFYQTTLEEALVSGSPTVLVFATPAYCTTATCGPMLDTVKALAPGYPQVNFIHIEVYTGFGKPGFAPDPAHLAPAVGADYWNLQSEPWVFLIDEGAVTARFEGVMAAEELASLLG